MNQNENNDVKSSADYKPVRYHPAVPEFLERSIAQGCSFTANEVREATEAAVQTRHQEARVVSQVLNGDDAPFSVFLLNVWFNPGVQAYYTIEDGSFVIRGYQWDIDREPRDDFDGGGFYCDNLRSVDMLVPTDSWKPSRCNCLSTSPRIYVASLADYAAGRTHGRWIDADQSVAGIQGQIEQMLAASSEALAEKWAIRDCEGFGSLRLGEFDDLKYIAEVAHLMQEHGTLFTEVVQYASNLEEARRYMSEGYCGEFERLEDYVQEVAEEYYGQLLDKLPTYIQFNIDYEGAGHDMELHGEIFTIEHDGKIHVFNPND